MAQPIVLYKYRMTYAGYPRPICSTGDTFPKSTAPSSLHRHDEFQSGDLYCIFHGSLLATKRLSEAEKRLLPLIAKISSFACT